MCNWVVPQHQILWRSSASFSIWVLTLQQLHNLLHSFCDQWPNQITHKSFLKYSSHVFNLIALAFSDRLFKNYCIATVKVKLGFDIPLFWVTFGMLQFIGNMKISSGRALYFWRTEIQPLLTVTVEIQGLMSCCMATTELLVDRHWYITIGFLSNAFPHV